jgi:hypothetical protein
MKRPRIIFQFWVLLLLVNSSCPPPVLAQIDSNQILRKLDSAYYYPQKNGLTGLIATVVWEKGVFGGDNYKKSPSVKFSWNNVSDNRTFKVTGQSLKLPPKKQAGLLQFFSNYKEVLLPQTLTKKFSGYPGKVTHGNFGSRINLEIRDFKDGVSRYSLFVNDKLRNVSRMLIDRIEAPTKVFGAFKYIQKNGRWLVSESIARFDLGGEPYVEKTRYYYGQIENIWLVNRIDQTLIKGGKELSRFIFKIKDYLLNWSDK